MKKKDETKVLPLRGISTDEEHDLLRAMLVTAASGLDSMLKQLIKDALPTLIQREGRPLEELEKFIKRRIRVDAEAKVPSEGASFLAHVLVAPSTQSRVIEEYVSFLTKGSLQSVSELERIATALDLARNEVNIDENTLKDIFEARNKIVHELDINFDAARRNRNVRGEAKMRAYTNTLIALAEQVLESVDKKLHPAT
jgi:hypothetical protein